MLSDQIAKILFLFAAISGMALYMLDLIGASIYDFRQIKRQKAWLKHPNAKRFRHKPLISVIVPVCDEEDVIERCLASIIKSSYRKLEIIVVDDASTDNTKQIVTEFIERNSKKTIRFIKKYKYVGRGKAINAGFNRYAKGELVMTLDADSVLDKHALRNTVKHFAVDDIGALASNLQIMEYPSILGLLQQFEGFLSFRAKKLYTISSAEYTVGSSGTVYRRNVFVKLKSFYASVSTEDLALSPAASRLGNKKFRLCYAGDVIVFNEPLPTYKDLFNQRYRWKLGSLQALFGRKSPFLTGNQDDTKSFTWYRLPLIIWTELLLLLEPFLLVYFVYLAVEFKQPLLYGVSWLAISLLLAFAIWSDDQLPLSNKIKLTGFIPIMFNLLIIVVLIQIAATIKCLINFRTITGRKLIRGSWQPPKRIAQKLI